ncbi:MAG: hypothetical protein H7Z19_02530, partial [Chitinophagaceae bacterium]|nr:hypothetical protein [Rubrivivax sp.]
MTTPAHHLFRLSLTDATVWLELPAQNDGSSHGVAQARALAPALAALAGLEQWLGGPLLAVSPADPDDPGDLWPLAGAAWSLLFAP